MRVTMLVRCLAMMRGGGETRHLAWARELAALGVDVDIIAGVPLVSGGGALSGRGRRRRADPVAVRARLRLSLSEPPWVRPPHDDGAAPRRGVVLPRGVASDCRRRSPARHRARARVASGGAAANRRDPGRDQPSGSAESAVYRGPAAKPTRSSPTAGRRRICRRRSARRSSGCRRASMPTDSVLTDPSVRERLGLAGKRVVLTIARLVPIKNVQLLARRDGTRPRTRGGRASGDRRRRLRGRLAARIRGRARDCGCRDVRRIRAARRDAGLLSRRRRLRALVGFRQLAERRARGDGVRRCRSSPPTSAACGNSSRIAPARRRARSSCRRSRRDCRGRRNSF